MFIELVNCCGKFSNLLSYFNCMSPEIKVGTIGIFEDLKPEQNNLIEYCSYFSRGGKVFVALLTDEAVSEHGGSKPSKPYNLRSELLLTTGQVDEVIPVESLGRAKDLLIDNSPNIFAMGMSWHDRNWRNIMGLDASFINDNSLSIAYVPDVPQPIRPLLKDGMRVYTAGTFDLVHAGHVDLFDVCRQVATQNGEVVVALNTDEFILRYKGKSPTWGYDERARIIEAIRYVDRVVKNEAGEDSKPAIIEVSPDIVVIGADWYDKDYMKQMSFSPAWLNQQKIVLMYCPRSRNMSTSETKDRVRKHS